MSMINSYISVIQIIVLVLILIGHVDDWEAKNHVEKKLDIIWQRRITRSCEAGLLEIGCTGHIKRYLLRSRRLLRYGEFLYHSPCLY